MNQYRTLVILDEIINHYASHQEALSARLLARNSQLSLSPTTIRNLMDDLSQQGLLTTEGVSRGRIPTPKAYTVYLHRLQQQPDTATEIPPLDELKGKQLKQALDQAGEFLAKESNFTVFAWLPPRNEDPLDWVRLFAIENNQVLVVTRTLFGELWCKVLTSSDPFPQSLLDEVQQYINSNYHKQSLSNIRQDVMVGKPQAVLANMPSIGSAFRLLRRAFEWDDAPRPYYWGKKTIYRWLKFENIQQIKQIEKYFQDPQPLLEVLKQGHSITHSANPKNELKVAIGSDLPHFSSISITGCSVQLNQWQAWIALLGPIWMNYQQMIALTHQTTQQFNQWLGSL